VRTGALVLALSCLLAAQAEESPASATLTWKAIDLNDCPPHAVGQQDKSLTVGPAIVVPVEQSGTKSPKLEIEGAEQTLESGDTRLSLDGTDLLLRWDGTRLTLRASRRMQGSVVLAGRLRSVAFLGSTLLLDLDGDRNLAGNHEIVRPGEPFSLRGRGYEALFEPRTGVLKLHPVEMAPPQRLRAWTPPRPPVEPRWVFWTKPGGKLSKLAAEYRRERKARRREKFPDVFVKRLLYEIGLLRTRKALRFLRTVYEKDKNVRVRAVAVEAMGFPEHVAEAKKLFEVARRPADSRPSEMFGTAPTYKIHAAAAEALHFMNAPDRADLYFELLDASDSELAGACARGLGYLGTEEGWVALAQRLDAHVTAEKRSIGGADVDDLYRGVRHGPHPPKLAWMLAARDEVFTRDMVLRDLLALGYPDARDHALALATAKRHVWLPEDLEPIATALATAADAEAVRVALAPPVASARGPLRRLLPAVRDPAALQALIEALDGPANLLALDILAQIPVPQVSDALRARLAAKPSIGLIEAVARTGGLSPDFVTGLLQSKDWRERVAGLRILAPPVQSGTLAEALSDARWRVRLAAVEAAERLGVHDGVRARLAAPDENLRVRRAAAHCLEETPPTSGSTWAGQPLETDRVIFLVDPPEDLGETLDSLPDGTLVNLYLVRGRVSAWRKELTALDRAARRDLRRILRMAKPKKKASAQWAPALERAYSDESADTIVLVGAAPVALRDKVRSLDPTRSIVVHGLAPER
jgi:hypothetical protein